MVKESFQTCIFFSYTAQNYFSTEDISFIKVMRFAFPVSLQKSLTSSFTLNQTIDRLFYGLCLINLPWSSEALSST